MSCKNMCKQEVKDKTDRLRVLKVLCVGCTLKRGPSLRLSSKCCLELPENSGGQVWLRGRTLGCFVGPSSWDPAPCELSSFLSALCWVCPKHHCFNVIVEVWKCKDRESELLEAVWAKSPLWPRMQRGRAAVQHEFFTVWQLFCLVILYSEKRKSPAGSVCDHLSGVT